MHVDLLTEYMSLSICIAILVRNPSFFLLQKMCQAQVLHLISITQLEMQLSSICLCSF